MPNYTDTTKPDTYRGALPDRRVPPCPRCGTPTYGWPPQTVGITYAVCRRCGKLFNR